jgi:Domain of unknown function (DUF4249)
MKIYKILFALALFSCTKEIDLPLLFEGKRLVVHCFLSNDTLITAKVSKTVPPSGPVLFDSLRVGEADFSVYQNNIPYDTLVPVVPGFFRGKRKPQPGQTYKITVSNKDFPDIYSEDLLLPDSFSIKLQSYALNKIPPINKGFPSLEATLQISDDKNTSNYYSIYSYLRVNGKLTNNFNAWIPNTNDFSGDPCLTDAFFFPDICFNGETFDYKIAFETQTLDKERAAQLILIIRNITKGYYEYLSKNSFQPEGFETAFSEYSLNYSNIQGGYGVFGGYFERRIIINL